MPSLVAATVALLVTWLVVRSAVHLLFRGSAERVAQLLWPKRPTRTDVAMFEVGQEGSSWRFGRVILLALIIPACFGLTFLAVRGVLLAVS
jgi:hypothetical protein